jgi:hypothetical protein
MWFKYLLSDLSGGPKRRRWSDAIAALFLYIKLLQGHVFDILSTDYKVLL